MGGAWGILLILRGVLLYFAEKTLASTPPLRERADSDQDPSSDPKDQGDYHSGPGGYEPNTAYPDTHYGQFGDD